MTAPEPVVPAPPPARLACDVLVVGYGPVGMTAAALLAQFGMSVVVVERHQQRYGWHRAGHLEGETMRTFQRLGVAEQIELIAQPTLDMEMRDAGGTVLTSYEMGSGGSGWKADYIAYQPHFERPIHDRNRELGVRIFMGAAVRAITQDADRATAEVHSSNGVLAPVCTIEAQFVIGADGANSAVRDCVGAQRRDLGFRAMPQLVIDFEFRDPDCDLPQLFDGAFVLDPERVALNGRWSGRRHARWEFAAREGESREQLESEELAWELIGEWGITPRARLDRAARRLRLREHRRRTVARGPGVPHG